MSNSASASINFDWAADFYDQTRTLSPTMSEAMLNMIRERVPASGSRFLELGVGTGRIAVPILNAGYPLVGIDLSRAMMSRMQAKLPPTQRAALVQGDVTWLPFPDDSFDAALAVHVFHLVGGWRTALAETQRVLKPGGFLFYDATQRASGGLDNEVRRKLRELVRARGGDIKRPGGEREDVLAALTEIGATVETVEVAHWERTHSIRDIIDQLASRKYSTTQLVPEEVLAPAIAELRVWAEERWGDLDAPHTEPGGFTWQVARFP
ncbi:MAG: class I SAM-dependent methyltransferase [Anaerolineae bacterium]